MPRRALRRVCIQSARSHTPHRAAHAPAAPQRYSVFAHKKISTSCSSVGEIRLKENCERLMSQLEADIKKLTLPGPLYVKEE